MENVFNVEVKYFPFDACERRSKTIKIFSKENAQIILKDISECGDVCAIDIVDYYGEVKESWERFKGCTWTQWD